LARRVEALEAAVFRLVAELDRLRGSTSKPAPSSARSRRIVLAAITRRIEADGGAARAATSEIAVEVSLHQTYVAAILKTLEAEGRLIASGRRTRIYRLPSAEIA
jgi:DNA-binding MarR family transcriptional regulator